MAKIIGYVNKSFTPKGETTVISGMEVYFTEPIKEKGKGESAEKAFLTVEKVSQLSTRLEVGMEVDVIYNKFGKVRDFRPLDPTVDFGSEIE